MESEIIDKNKEYPKILKCTSGYVEEKSFEKAVGSAGYFCQDCTYFIEGNKCAIVQTSGSDVNGIQSDIIAPYGSCDLWLKK
jgi:hypothetical protein